MNRPKRIKKRHATPHESVSVKSIFKSVFLALPIAIILGMLLLVLATALLLRSKDPNAYHTAAGLVIIYLVALLGGIITARLHHRQAPLLCGLAMGAVMLFMLVLISLILPDGSHSYTPAVRFGQHALMLPCTITGALLGAKKHTVKPRHRRM